jgi:hypothetical protein
LSLTDLATLIQDTNAAIIDAERFLAAEPNDIFARLNAQSLQKRLSDLQERFDEAASLSQVEVLRYRLFKQPAEVSLRTVNELLATFQQSFTVVYDSIASNTAKKRARLSENTLRSTNFNFAYSYAGSLGFALTLPREPTLLANDHDEAIQVIRELTQTRDEADVKSFADNYGLASVRTMYKWLDALSKADADAELDWRGSAAESEPFIIQVADARVVRDLIARTSDVEYTERPYRGTLLAYDSQRHTFRFAVGNRRTIHGSVSHAITDPLEVPEEYDVLVRVSTVELYSTEQTEERYELTSIAPAGSTRVL